jgi:hypothetical protein
VTPREADIALLLESVDCVVATYAAKPRAADARAYDFIVEVRPFNGATMAQAHYLLRRLLTHAECARVLIRDADLGPRPEFLLRARLLVLDDTERREARSRLATLAPPSDGGELAPPSDKPDTDNTDIELRHLRILAVGPCAFGLTTGAAAKRVQYTTSNGEAIDRLRERVFDLVVWDVSCVGPALPRLLSVLASRPDLSEDIVFVASAKEFAIQALSLESKGLESIRLRQAPPDGDMDTFLRSEIRARSAAWRARCVSRG